MDETREDAAGGTVMRAYSYGCPYWADPGSGLIEQLRLANRLWNRLVEIEREHETAKAAIWLTDPGVASAAAAHDAAAGDLAAVRALITEHRKADRSTVPRDADTEALEAARTAVTSAKAALDAAREAAGPGLREAFAAAKKARAQAVKGTYPEFTGMGLGWGTCNDITRRRFPGAVAKVEARRKAGLPAQLRFRRFDGAGTLTIQIQRSAGQPPRTMPALNSGTHPRSRTVSLEPWRDPDTEGRHPRGDERHGTLTGIIGRSREHGPARFSLPVVLDRWLPAGADIAEVKVSRRRTAGTLRWGVSLICAVPAPVPPGGGNTVALRLGWASAGGGWLRVAAAGAVSPLPPLPASLSEVVRVSADGMSAEILMPPEWRRLLDRDDDIRAIRDQNLDVVREKTRAALAADLDLAAALEVTAGDVARWRSPARFARLTRIWPPADGLAAVLEEWRQRDRHLWEFEANERAQVLARRRDAYRCVAAWLCSDASSLTVDGLDLARLKRVPGMGREDSEMERAARANVHEAAPGELRAAVVAAAGRRGIPVITVKTRKQDNA